VNNMNTTEKVLLVIFCIFDSACTQVLFFIITLSQTVISPRKHTSAGTSVTAVLVRTVIKEVHCNTVLQGVQNHNYKSVILYLASHQ
jgi:hypothetical protein